MSITYDINGNESGFRSAMDSVAGSAERTAQRVQGAFAPVNGLFDRVKSSFNLIAAAVAGKFIFDQVREAVNATFELNDAAADMGDALGISATQAGELIARTRQVDIETEVYTSSLIALQKQLAANESGMQQLGLQTRDANGNLRNGVDLLDDSIKILSEYRAGTDRTQAAMVLLGKGASSVDELLKVLETTQEDVRATTDALGLSITEQSLAMSDEYDSALKQGKESLLGVRNAIGSALMPAVTDMVNVFNTAAPAAVTVLRGALGGLMSVFYAIETGVRVVYETIFATIYNIVEPIRGLIEAAGLVLQGDFQGAAAAISQSGANVANNWDAAFDRMAASATRTRDRIWNTFAQGDDIAAPDGSGTQYGGEGRKAESRMPEFEAALAARKLAFAQAERDQGTFHEFAKEAEARYWREIAAMESLSQTDRAAARKKAIDLELGLYREAGQQKLQELRTEADAVRNDASARLELLRATAEEIKRLYGEDSDAYRAAAQGVVQAERAKVEQLRRIADIEAQARQDSVLSQIDAERQALEESMSAGTVSRGQYLEELRRFEDARTQILLDGLRARLEAENTSPDRNPETVAQLHAQIEAMELGHRQRLGEIARQGSIANNPDFQNMMGNLQSQWNQGLNAMLAGTLSWRSALSGLWQGIYTEFLQQMITAPIARWLAKEATLTVVSLAGSQQRVAIEGAAAAQSTAITAGAALKNIAIRAWEAIAGAYAAIAGIPYVGPFLAPAVALGAGAFVFGLAKNVISAEGGYDIPAGVNPMVQTHEREMILPAKYADMIRSATNNGGAGSGGGDTFNVSFIDAKGVRKLLREHGTDLADALRQQNRNFNSQL